MTDSDNPFFQDSALPLLYPAFDEVTERHFEPAFEAGMAEHAEEVERIASHPAPATFTNTIEALERSGQVLSRVSAVFFNLVASNATAPLQKLHEQVAPQLSTHHDAIYLNAALFARIDQLHRDRNDLGLTGEQLRLLEKVHTAFVRAGAGLSEQDARELRAINEELSTLAAQFSAKLLADTSARAVHITNVEELEGLSADRLDATAQAAEARTDGPSSPAGVADGPA
jgi:peptidyl-dipeptidase Dcp